MKKSTREEKSIIDFLLGQATEEDRGRIEDRFFRDPEYHEQMLAIEEDLICDYVRGALSAGERSQFETHFLGSDRRRRKYELTRDLAAYVSTAYVTTPALSTESTAGLSWLRRLFRDTSGLVDRRMAWGMAAVVLFAFLGSALLINLRFNHNTEGQTEDQQQARVTSQAQPAEHQTQAARAVPSAAIEIEKPNAGRKPVSDKTSNPAARPKLTEPAFVPAFIVNLQGVRGAGADDSNEITIPSNVTRIELHLPLSETEYPNYEAIIKTLDGDTVWHRAKLKPRLLASERIVVLTIPSRILEEREYVLNLCCMKEIGRTKIGSESFFSVKRQK